MWIKVVDKGVKPTYHELKTNSEALKSAKKVMETMKDNIVEIRKSFGLNRYAVV